MAEANVTDRDSLRLCSMADTFPLGRAFGHVELNSDPASAAHVRPFGLQFAVELVATRVDFSAFEYDASRQVGVVRSGGTAVPLCRHTTGPTRTQTSDAHERLDTDSDQRADD